MQCLQNKCLVKVKFSISLFLVIHHCHPKLNRFLYYLKPFLTALRIGWKLLPHCHVLSANEITLFASAARIRTLVEIMKCQGT